MVVAMVAVAPVAPVAVAVVMDVKEACGRERTGGGEEGGNVVDCWVTSSAGGRAGGQAGGRVGGRAGARVADGSDSTQKTLSFTHIATLSP